MNLYQEKVATERDFSLARKRIYLRVLKLLTTSKPASYGDKEVIEAKESITEPYRTL